jgi:hypothetical protein
VAGVVTGGFGAGGTVVVAGGGAVVVGGATVVFAGVFVGVISVQVPGTLWHDDINTRESIITRQIPNKNRGFIFIINLLQPGDIIANAEYLIYLVRF